MPHVPGCGCPGPAKGPCPLDPTPPEQQREMSTADLVRAALAGEIQPEQQQTSAGRPLALNDDDGLRAVILSALGAKNTNQQ